MLVWSWHRTQDGALKCLFDPEPDVILSGNDKEGAEYDEGEAHAVLDQEEVEVIVLGVGEEEADVIIGNVEENETGQKNGGPAGWGILATLSKGETYYAEDEGEQGA